MSKCIAPIVQRHDSITFCTRSFSNYDHRITWTLRSSMQGIDFAESRGEQLENALVSKRMFRDKYHVGLARDSRPEREVSRMSAHHLDNLHPTVRAGRRPRSFEHLRYIPQRRIETECVIRAGEILVDRFRHAHDLDSTLRQLRPDTHRVFATANDERFDPEPFDVVENFRMPGQGMPNFRRNGVMMAKHGIYDPRRFVLTDRLGTLERLPYLSPALAGTGLRRMG